MIERVLRAGNAAAAALLGPIGIAEAACGAWGEALASIFTAICCAACARLTASSEVDRGP